MLDKVNIGCGQTPTKGWQNYDNSISIKLSKMPLLPTVLYKFGLLHKSQYEFIKYALKNSIKFGDASKKLWFKDNSISVIYSSHMLEHLDKYGASIFLKEAFRVLKPNGIIRIVVPDIQKLVNDYMKSNNANEFIEKTGLCEEQPRKLLHKLSATFIGTRNHQWMYDGKSLINLITTYGFKDAKIMTDGETYIENPGQLNLKERISESVCVEAKKI